MRILQANMRGLSCCTRCRKEIDWLAQYYIDNKTRKLYCLKCNEKDSLLYIIKAEWRRMRDCQVCHIFYYVRNVFRRYTGRKIYG